MFTCHNRVNDTLCRQAVARHLLLRRLDLCGDHAALVQNLVQLPRVHLQQQLRFHVGVEGQHRGPIALAPLGAAGGSLQAG
jgi:hypothetical protein